MAKNNLYNDYKNTKDILKPFYSEKNIGMFDDDQMISSVKTKSRSPKSSQFKRTQFGNNGLNKDKSNITIKV